MRSCHLVGLMVFAAMGLVFTSGETFAQERTDFPKEARERFDKAREYQQRGQLTEAISAYQQAIGLGMQAYPRAYLYQADALLQMKKLDEAINYYTKLLEKFSLEDSCRL